MDVNKIKNNKGSHTIDKRSDDKSSISFLSIFTDMTKNYDELIDPVQPANGISIYPEYKEENNYGKTKKE